MRIYRNIGLIAVAAAGYAVGCWMVLIFDASHDTASSNGISSHKYTNRAIRFPSAHRSSGENASGSGEISAKYEVYLKGLPSIVAGVAARNDFLEQIRSLDPGEYCFEETLYLDICVAGQEDPYSILSYLLESPIPRTKDLVAQGLFDGWAQIDPAAAIAAVEKLPDGPNKTWLSAQLSSSLVKSNPEEALEWFKRSGQAVDNSILINIFQNIGSKNIETAIQNLSNLKSGQQHISAIKGVAKFFAESDIKKGVAWANDINDDQGKKAALGVLVSKSIKQSTADFDFLISNLNSQEEKASMIFMAMHPAVGGDFETLYRSAEENLTGPILQNAESNLISVMGSSENFDSASEIIEKMPMGGIRDGCLDTLISKGVDLCPHETYNWLVDSGEWNFLSEDQKRKVREGVSGSRAGSYLNWGK
ncbi:hypothetical protein KBB96_03315 [Luteolibacter ambystomatis]|uniref:Uncharacterized protein n=1 Tax=Luteolibacter ambystomatis TaxID=2824561 RepID=A0A975PFC0_9BACT|nr:hypothetical protein [Luteolibacter ambystomatis]QUE51924.1 hypothetical protein KBB96_03315 [Luteolibacter ambystomatis]